MKKKDDEEKHKEKKKVTGLYTYIVCPCFESTVIITRQSYRQPQHMPDRRKSQKSHAYTTIIIEVIGSDSLAATDV
jgi:nitric oxide synthase oxygenase domain/subunit